MGYTDEEFIAKINSKEPTSMPDYDETLANALKGIVHVNKGYKLPSVFSIMKKNEELVRVWKNKNGSFTGEVINYDRSLTYFTDKMVWFNDDIVNWLESRTIPKSRPALFKSLDRLDMDHWDLEELMCLTRAIRYGDFIWLKFAENETVEALHPRYDEEALPWVDIDKK